MAQRTYTIRVPTGMASVLERESRLSGLSVPRLAKKELVSRLARPPTDCQNLELPKHGAPGINVAVGLNDDEQERLAQWMTQHNVHPEDDAKLLSALLFWDAPPPSVRVPSANADDSRLRRINRARGQADRAEQDQIYLALRRHLDRRTISGDAHEGKVLLAEAPTGVGKTRAFVVAALDRVHEDHSRVGLIACPTIALILQVAGELHAIREAGEWVPVWRCMFGMGEFVSAQSLERAVAEGHEHGERITKWLAQNGRADAARRELPAYLADDLVAFLGGGESLDESCYLRPGDDPDDPAMQAYKGQFTHGDGAQLLIATHAMVAREIQARLSLARRWLRENGQPITRAEIKEAFDKRRAAAEKYKQDKKALKEQLRANGDQSGVDVSDPELFKKIVSETLSPPEMILGDVLAQRFEVAPDLPVRLPNLDFAIIDEGHLFETNLSQSLSSGISTWSVLHHARSLQSQVAAVSKRDITALTLAFEGLRAAWRAAVTDNNNNRQLSLRADMSDGGKLWSQVRDFKDALSTILAKRRAKSFSSPDLRALKDAERTLDLLMPTDRTGFQAYISASPVLNYPQIICGRPQIDTELAYFWRAIANNAVVVSATLSMPSAAHPYEHYRRILGITLDRLCTMPPVTPPWLTRGVTLLTPAHGVRPDGSARLSPAKVTTDDDEALHQIWVEEGCRYIQTALASIPGGSLMLCGSYRDLNAFQACLQSHQFRVIAMRRGHRIDECLPEFYAAAIAGEKPILLGTGPAWTGLDIGGHRVSERGHAPIQAQDDNVLTDLFIPRLPFGLNNSITHLHRKSVIGFSAETYAVAFHLKQAMGRLVRRPGLPGNRRIHLMDGRINDPDARTYVGPIRSLISIYPQQALL